MTLLICVSFIMSCGGKYSPIESTEDELRVIGSIDEYSVYYDELRCSVMNAKSLMSSYHNINWNDENSYSPYKDELEKRVFEGLRFNYAVQILFKETGYTIDHESIQSSVQSQIEKLIDECGSRKKYIQYLEENYLTDRVLRFNIAISYALNELLFALNDSGAFDDYVDFDFTAITLGDSYFDIEEYAKAMDFIYSGKVLLRSEHIFISSEKSDHKQLADSTYSDLLINGTDFSVAAETAKDYASHDTMYMIQGEFDEEYYSAVNELSIDEISILHTDSGSYIIRRLDLDPTYLNINYYDIIYTYLSIKENEHIEAYAKTLELKLSEFGKNISLIDMK